MAGAYSGLGLEADSSKEHGGHFLNYKKRKSRWRVKRAAALFMPVRDIAFSLILSFEILVSSGIHNRF
jgi:hypothetical protein